MKKLILSLLLLLTITCPSFAAENKIITLQDGSKVKGTILGMDNGFYVVETPSIGEVRIADSKITSITTSEQPDQPEAPSNITATPEFKAVQTQVMNNPAILGDIQKLMDDPEVMSIISDPEFIAAIKSGNPGAVGSNPRLKALSENPKVQALIQKIKSQQ